MPFDKNKKYVYRREGQSLDRATPARFVETEPTLPASYKNTFYVCDPEKAKSGQGGFYVTVNDEGKNGFWYIEEAQVYTNWYKNPAEPFYRVYAHDEKEEATNKSNHADGLIASAFPMHIPSQ